MKDVPQKRATVRRLLLAIIIAFLVQCPFLILMNFAGVHSALGGVWVVFYLPAIWLLDRTGIPDISQFVTTLALILFQEIVLLCVIVPLIALCVRVKSHN